MKIRYLVAASAAALIAASGAQAADIVNYQESAPVVAVPAFSWQGFYIGGQIGGSWADTDAKVRGVDGFRKTMSPDPDGFIGGLYAGYNFDVGNNVIVGAETDFVWSDMSESSRFDNGTDIYKLNLKQKWMGATRVRVGYAVDRFLPYIAGGVAYGRLENRIRDIGTATTDLNWNKTLTGWTIGAGVDYAVTDNILARLEYRYTDLGDKSHRLADGASSYKVDYKTNDFRVGVAYKF